jgi:hypothetical protein
MSAQNSNRRDLLTLGIAAGATILVAKEASAQSKGPEKTFDLREQPLEAPNSSNAPVVFSDSTDVPSTESLREALSRDQQAWESLLSRVRSEMPLPKNPLADKLHESLNSAYEALAVSLRGVTPNRNEAAQARSAIFLGFAPKADESQSFRFWHCDVMLEDAAELLERCIRDITLHDEYAVRAFDARIAIEQFAQLDTVHEKEIKAGYYTVNGDEAQQEHRAEVLSASGNEQAASTLQWLRDSLWNTTKVWEQVVFSVRAAWVSHYATYKADHKNDLLAPIFNNAQKSIPDHLYDAALGQTTHSMSTQLNTLVAELQSRKGTGQSERARSVGKEARAKWEKNDGGFRRERTQVIRNFADLKARAFYEPGGILNYLEKMLPLRNRCVRDFNDAVSRISVSARGLKLIYGYDSPVPSVLSDPGDSVGAEAFTEALIWVRDALSFLSRFQQVDHNYVVAVSVRHSLSPGEWNAGKQRGEWSLNIAEELFGGDLFVRLRGVSAFVECDRSYEEEHRGLWTVTMVPPETSYCVHEGKQRVELEQIPTPLSRAARATTRDSARDPDTVGVMALRNLSPFGSWKVKVGSQSTTGTKLSKIEDVVIDLQLAVQRP